MTNSQLTDLRTLILSEVGDFFAGVGSPGEPETPEEMQRELSMRLGRILNNHIVNYPRCEVLVEILRECRAARDEAQAELQERRKADSEPVAWTDEEELRDANESGSGYLFGIARDANKFADPRRQIMLYRHAQPAPVSVPEDVASAIEALKQTLVDCNRYNYCLDAVKCVEDACRAAMLQAEPVTTANKLGNSPVIPDGYVMVPKEPTEEMNKAGWAAMNEHDAINPTYRAMLAAAPQDTPALNSVQSVVTVSDTWIPVSERMPEDEQEVLTINRMGHRFVSLFDKHSGLFFDRLDAPSACCIEHVLVTHWMELPAAPQEVRHG